MKVLVTGGAGFIGSNLIDELLARGNEVVALDDLSSGRRENLEGAIEHGLRLFVEDVSDAGAVQSIMESERPECVFHLAAQIDVRASAANPSEDARINVVGTVVLLEAAHQSGAKRVVFASSGAVYGDASSFPVAETAETNPVSPYGQAKHAGEGYCELYERTYGLSTISLRLGNIYGPRQSPHSETGVIAIFCGLFLEGKTPTIYGDGRQTRDYTHVSDVVEAMRLAGESEACGPHNIGTGVETSVIELADEIQAAGNSSPAVAGTDFEPQFAPAVQGEVNRIALDPGKTRQALGFAAGIDVRSGLRTTLEGLS